MAAFFLFLCVVTSVTALAALPPAGASIQNTASASYNNTFGSPESLTSNTVRFTVSQVASFTLGPTQTRATAPGATLGFPLILTNTGNGTDTFALAATNLTGGGFDFSSVTMYLDGGGGAPVGAPITSTGPLAVGSQFAFVVIAVVPGTASVGSADQIRVDAASAFNSAVTTTGPAASVVPATLTGTVTAQAVVTLAKTFSVVSGASPASGVLVQIAYVNTSPSVSATNVVISDVIGTSGAGFNTSGFTYVPGSAGWNLGGALTDAAGGDPPGIDFDFNVTAPLTATARIGSVPPGSGGVVRFRIDVNSGLTVGASTTNNRAAVSYFDGVVIQSGVSNNAFYQVLGVSAGVDLQVTKSHTGNFTANNAGSYTIGVLNQGAVASSGTITVVDTLPAGLVFVAAGSGGNGWSCSASGAQITCVSSAVVPARAGSVAGVHPDPLTIRVMPNASALPALPTTVVNTVIVAGGGETAANASNNSAADPTTVEAAAAVSGLVWRDFNHNRTFDEGSSAVLGSWLIEVCPANAAACDAGNRIAVTNTAADGTYRLSNLVPGQYKIQFRDPQNNLVVGRPVNGDGVNPPQSNSALDATGQFLRVSLLAGENKLSQSMPLDPSGVVYDAVTRQPVAGAVVRLAGPAGFDPAIHLLGGLTNVAQTTSANGSYQFLLTHAGISTLANQVFTITVTPPAGYQPGPSTLIPPAASFPSGACAGAQFCLDPTGLAVSTFSVQPANLSGAPPQGADTRYFLRFALAPGDPDVVNNHIPLDPAGAAASGLFTQKTVSRAIAELGEFIEYTVKVRNATGAALADVRLLDVLPKGFGFVTKTARLEGALIADPAGNKGPQLEFSLGALASDATATLVYRVFIGPTAQLGDGINQAQAIAGATRSNFAQARVRVQGGVFSEKAFILGKIYLDCNRNNVQDAGELGVPGVRLYLEDGTFVVSDSEGKYSFHGISPHTHVLRVDEITLPVGAVIARIVNRQGGNPRTRFVDLKNGELHRADFAIAGCPEGIVKEVEARRAKGDPEVAQTTRLVQERLPAEPIRPAGDVRSAPASGIVGQPLGQPLGQPGASGASPSHQPIAPTAPPSPATSSLPAIDPLGSAPLALTLESQLEQAGDNQLGILNLKDRDTLPIAQTNVQAKGVHGAIFRLYVNGVEIPATRVGKRSVLESKQAQAWEYIGINLEPGANTIRLAQLDPLGNARGEVSLVVIAPDRLGKVSIDAPATAIADGQTPVKLRVRLTDARGVAVTTRLPLTLESTLGRFAAEDVNPHERGVQVFTAGGSAEVVLLPPQHPGDAVIRIASGTLVAEHKISFLPELRPLIGVGVIEGALNLRRLDLRNVASASARDTFEAELRHFSYRYGEDKREAAARAAFFLKGKVKGDYLLTLAYDSDKNLRDQLFRDIQPDQFYPIYGDAALKGFDAQSTSRLYVRVDRGKSYVLYGDFVTQTPHQARTLANYARSLTGFRQHYETPSVVVNTFVANDTLRQVVEEIPANGTSGPFQLNNRGAIINSEKVEILTRDRSQPALVLKSDLKSRFADYEIEPFTGRLLFKGPVASVDANFNPQSIRITYEVDQGGQAFWTGGIDAQLRVLENLEVGGAWVKDNNPLSPFTLSGAHAALQLAERSVLFAEVAQTERPTGRGHGERVELRHESQSMQARLHLGRTSKGFENPSAPLNKGREEGGAKLTYKIDAQTRAVIEGIHTSDVNTGASRQGVLVQMEHSLGEGLRIEAGVRHTQDTGPSNLSAPTLTANPSLIPAGSVTSARLKLTARVPYAPQASVFGEWEQALDDHEKRLLALGGEYRLTDKMRAYGRHEFISSLGSPFALNATQRNHVTAFGFDSAYGEGGRTFSEYRVRDAIDGRTAEAVTGLRHQWEVQKGLRLLGSAERIQALSGATSGESTAFATGVDYTAEEWWKGSTRLELRYGPTVESWLHTAGVAVKLDRDWSLLARTIGALTTTQGTAVSHRVQARGQLGLAYRDNDTNLWNGLGKIEHRYESDSATPESSFKREVLLGSVHVNYHPVPKWVLSGRYAAKRAREVGGMIETIGTAQLVSARITYDITDRWDAGLIGSAFGGPGWRTRQYGLGAELGYLLSDNLWASIGYNIFGFKDPDFALEDRTDRGFYLRLRLKFDETVFGAKRLRAIE